VIKIHRNAYLQNEFLYTHIIYLLIDWLKRDMHSIPQCRCPFLTQWPLTCREWGSEHGPMRGWAILVKQQDWKFINTVITHWIRISSQDSFLFFWQNENLLWICPTRSTHLLSCPDQSSWSSKIAGLTCHQMPLTAFADSLFAHWSVVCMTKIFSTF
jgi:hypothetical protein